MILNIRGTSGSGKSYLVRGLMEHFGPASEITNEGGKVVGYQLAQDIRVVGRYETACGGCDTISKVYDGQGGNSMDQVERIVRQWAAAGHVIFEGLIVTSVWGRWQRMAQELPVHFLFLNTPLEICYQRVLERSGGRTPKGWPGSSDLEAKYAGEQKRTASISRREEEVGRQLSSLQQGELRYTILQYEQAFEQIIEILEAEVLQ